MIQKATHLAVWWDLKVCMLWSGAAKLLFSFHLWLFFFFLFLILFLVKDEDCVPVVIRVQDWPTCWLFCIVVSHLIPNIIVLLVIWKKLTQSSDYINHSVQSHTGCKLLPVVWVYHTPTETNKRVLDMQISANSLLRKTYYAPHIPRLLLQSIQFHDVWIWKIHGISRHNFATSMSELAEAWKETL